MMPALFTRMSSRPSAATVSSTSRPDTARSPRSPVTDAARRPPAWPRAHVFAGERVLPCTATSAPASASATLMAAPRPAEAPGTSATHPSSRKESTPRLDDSFMEEIFADRREDVDQHDFLVEHRRAVADVRRKVQDVAGHRDARLAADRESGTPAFHDRHLLVRMRMHGCIHVRLERQAADHQLVAHDNLTIDPVGNPIP